MANYDNLGIQLDVIDNASKKLQILIYELKTARLDNFGNNNSENKRICNQCYREIIGYMTDKEQKYRKKYNNINY